MRYLIRQQERKKNNEMTYDNRSYICQLSKSVEANVADVLK